MLFNKGILTYLPKQPWLSSGMRVGTHRTGKPTDTEWEEDRKASHPRSRPSQEHLSLGSRPITQALFPSPWGKLGTLGQCYKCSLHSSLSPHIFPIPKFKVTQHFSQYSCLRCHTGLESMIQKSRSWCNTCVTCPRNKGGSKESIGEGRRSALCKCWRCT